MARTCLAARFAARFGEHGVVPVVAYPMPMYPTRPCVGVSRFCLQLLKGTTLPWCRCSPPSRSTTTGGRPTRGACRVFVFAAFFPFLFLPSLNRPVVFTHVQKYSVANGAPRSRKLVHAPRTISHTPLDRFSELDYPPPQKKWQGRRGHLWENLAESYLSEKMSFHLAVEIVGLTATCWE